MSSTLAARIDPVFMVSSLEEQCGALAAPVHARFLAAPATVLGKPEVPRVRRAPRTCAEIENPPANCGEVVVMSQPSFESDRGERPRDPDHTEEIDWADVRSTQRGDLDAFRRLFERYVGTVRRIAEGVVRHVDVEDVVQDAFIAVYRGIDRFDPERGAPRSLIFSIATHKALNRRRGETRRRIREAEVAANAFGTPHASSRPGGDLAFRQDLDECLDSLPAARRSAFDAWRAEQHDGRFSYAEAAWRLEIAVGTLKSRLSKALRSLRDCLRRKGW
ncbi:MAG: RNA polymerase sigma factor [Planctomycetes bacterium]|nr:RNA polymerase sigma factor [Planctomycetota bacterium]